ncbi:MAG: hypothetical protein EBS99_16470 [Betaproteobacteria bacterium]|nr:hypothetical protein [Betaproteobacteria bacterium]
MRPRANVTTAAARASAATGATDASPLWYQLYVWKDRGLSRELVQRAKAAGYQAIMVTVDTAVFGRRDRDVRRGFTLPPKIGLEVLRDGCALRPRGGGLGQFGHARRAGDGLSGQSHRHPDRGRGREPRPRAARAAGAQGGAGGGRPARAGHDRARIGGAQRGRLLAAQVFGAQCAHGRSGADARAHRRHPARPGVHRQDHGRPDRPGARGRTAAR